MTSARSVFLSVWPGHLVVGTVSGLALFLLIGPETSPRSRWVSAFLLVALLAALAIGWIGALMASGMSWDTGNAVMSAFVGGVVAAGSWGGLYLYYMFRCGWGLASGELCYAATVDKASVVLVCEASLLMFAATRARSARKAGRTA